jgi:hypothetical protein
MPDVVYNRMELFAGDRLIVGGRVDAAAGEDDPETVEATIVIGEKDGTLVRDLNAQDPGEVSVDADGDGGFVVRGEVAGAVTALWAPGTLFADIGITTDAGGPHTVERVEIVVRRGVVAEVAP